MVGFWNTTKGQEGMKRVETLTDEAFRIYINTLRMARICGSYEWECGSLECDMCPFNHYKDCLKVKSNRKSYTEWLKWGMEDVGDETDI